jgi:outer membrane receptor protein involved in Fe transport
LTGSITAPLGSAATAEVRVAARADATGFRDRDNEVGLGSQDRSDRILYAGVAAPLGFALFGGLAEIVLEGSVEHLDARDPVAVVPEPGALVRRRASAGVGIERAFGPVTLRAAGSLAAVADGHELVDTPIGQRPEPGDPPLRAEPAAGLGVRADLGSRAAVRANATYSVRAPTFEELFGNSGSVQGSAGLDPERALGVDAGVTFTHRRWDLSAGAYWQEVRDLIGYVQTSQRTARAENFGRARLRGLELGASARPLAWLGGRVAVGLLDAENLGDVPSQRGKRLPGRPAFDLGGAVEARLGIVGLGVDADVVAGNYLDPANLQEVPARAYLGASLRVEPVPGVLVTLWAKNVLDHRVAEVELHPAPRGGDSTIEQAVSDYGGFPLPGRALFLTLRWTQTGGPP